MQSLTNSHFDRAYSIANQPISAVVANMSDKTSGAIVPASPAPGRATPSAWTLLPTGIWIWLLIKTLSIPLFLRGHILSGLIVYFGPDPWLLYQILVPSGSGFGATYSRFRTVEKQVWLTIDDGPDPVTTPAILDLLDLHHAQATFFVIGAYVDAHPTLAAEIVRRGHELGNHTHNHVPYRLWRLWPRATAAEVDGCQEAIVRAVGFAPVRFRAPVGVKNVFLHALLGRRAIDFIAWSARGFDCILKPDTAVKRIAKDIRPGAIILVHEGKNDLGRVAVIGRVLEQLSAEGYRAIVPSREMLRSAK